MLATEEEGGHTRVGAAVLCGILAFLVLEKVLELSNPETNPELREVTNRSECCNQYQDIISTTIDIIYQLLNYWKF